MFGNRKDVSREFFNFIRLAIEREQYSEHIINFFYNDKGNLIDFNKLVYYSHRFVRLGESTEEGVFCTTNYAPRGIIMKMTSYKLVKVKW